MSDPTEFITEVLAMWTDADGAARRAVLERRFRPDVRFYDRDGAFDGHDGLERFSASLRERFPGAAFALLGPPEPVGDAFRAFWRFGPPEKPDAVSGMDFVIWDGERASAVYAFVNAPASDESTRPGRSLPP